MPNRVGRTSLAEGRIRNLRTDVGRRIEEIEQRLRDHGCQAADYRLTGEHVDRLCVVHVDGIRGGWRVVVAFPEPDAVVVLYVGRHDPRRGLDLYRELYEVVGIAVPAGPRTRPPCCDEAGYPPIDDAVLERIDLYRRRRR